MDRSLTLPGFLIVALGMAAGMQAQTLPNPGFEDWNTVGTACEDPDAWDTPNGGVALFGVCSVFKDESIRFSGSASARLVTTLIPLVNLRAPGVISNGTLVVNASDPFNSFVQGGSTIWGRPDALTGYYRYEPEGGDSLTIRVRLFDITGTDTTQIAEDEYFSSAATTDFVPFTLPINYWTADDAELAQVLVRSTRNTADATVGTTLWVDDFRFTGISGLDGSALPGIGWEQYPNPVDGSLNGYNPSTSSYTYVLVDRKGAVRWQSAVHPGNNPFDLTQLENGLYLYRLQDDRGAVVQTGKLQVFHP